MGKRGRPRKEGKRHPNGRLVHEATFDKGSDWVQAQRDRYGTHYSSALGRAYAGGLLADDADIAQDRYQGGNRFARVHNRVFGGETYRCPLDPTPHGSGSDTMGDHERDARDREWLSAAVASLDMAGCRPWLDQLINRGYTDHGPDWLDRLLEVERWNAELPAINSARRAHAKAAGVTFTLLERRAPDPRDQMILRAAIAGLDIVAPPRKDVGIRAAVYGEAA